MDDDHARLVHDIHARAARIGSVLSGYESVPNLRTIPLNAKGWIWFPAPDRSRAEARVSGRQITMVRNGNATVHAFSGASRRWPGLLRRIVGADGTENVLFQVDCLVEAANVPLDDGLFAVDEPAAGYRLVDIDDILLSSPNPDAAEDPPSPN